MSWLQQSSKSQSYPKEVLTVRYDFFDRQWIYINYDQGFNEIQLKIGKFIEKNYEKLGDCGDKVKEDAKKAPGGDRRGALFKERQFGQTDTGL